MHEIHVVNHYNQCCYNSMGSIDAYKVQPLRILKLCSTNGR